ncbi:MAG: PAS domain-containing protein, partial [Planctomycetes bacterium]|nr:PAS domain-containing protein [Planctomycetota bacterium]
MSTPAAALPDPQDELQARLCWLNRLRWVAIAGVFATVAVTHLALRALPLRSALALYTLAALMTAYNASFELLVRSVRAPRALALSQVILDLVALTVLLHFSGGVENPFFVFYVFHVIIASILLRPGESYAIAGLTSGLFAGLALAEHIGVLAHHHLALLHAAAAASTIESFAPGAESGALAHQPAYLAGLVIAFAATCFFSVYFASSIMEAARAKASELAQATAAALAEREKLNNVVSSIGGGLAVVGADHKILWHNDRIRDWVDTPGSVCGTYCHEILWGEDSRCDNCPAEVAFRTGRPCQSEKFSKGPANARRSYLVTASPIRDAAGRVSHVLEFIQDVTDRKEMEASLVQAGKMVAVGELASGIAHEIANPLAAIGASAELLREVADGPALRDRPELEAFPRHLEKIERQVFRCKEIIQSLLAFARRGEPEAPLLPVDLNRVAEETLRLIEESARAQSKEIVREFAPDLPRVAGDPQQLQQVLLNLLTNALDALPGPGRIRIGSRRGPDGRVQVWVADSGCGIPAANLPRIFDPFFTTKPPGKGTGLGLYLCRRILTHLGGTVECASEPGRGATFTVTLPARTPERGESGAGVAAGGA